jgi:hypothetical protein
MDTIKRFIRKSSPSTLILFLFFFSGIFLLSFAFLDPDTAMDLVREDGAIENMQAILYLLGAGLWGFAFIFTSSAKGNGKRRQVFFILFLALFLFFFLEEISWGQRMFGFSTPESLEGMNMQDETNIHNIGWGDSLLWVHLIMGLFVVTVGIIFPVLKLGSKRASTVFDRLKFPVVHHNLIACFCMALVFYSDPGFHWYVPLILIAIFFPIIIILSGKFSDFFDKFENPLLQFSSMAIIGSLVIVLNVNLETAHYLSNNIAFEIRELFIALALFFFSAFEAYGAWKKKNKSKREENPQQLTANGI